MAEPVLEMPDRQAPRSYVPARPSRRILFLGIGLGAGLIVGVLLGLFLAGATRPPQPWEPRALLMSPYHAVRLSTGQVLVGRVDRLAAPFTIVTGAYVIEPTTNAETKQVSWSVVPRGAEWDSPATLILSAQQVVSIEAIKPGSKLSALLDDLRTKQ